MLRAAPLHRLSPTPPLRRRRAKLGAAGVSSLLVLLASQAGTAPSAVAATNLVGNPGFDADTAGWNAPESDLSRVGGRDGDYAVRLNDPRDGVAVLNDTPNTVESTSLGASYTASAWVRTSTPPLTAELRIREVTEAGEVTSSTTSVTLDGPGWERVSVSHAAVLPASWLDLNVLVPSMPAEASLNVDDVSVVSSATPPPVEPPVVPPTGCTVNSKLVPSCGALWGVYNPIGSMPGATNWTTAITTLESKVGRRFDLVKRYHDFSNSGSSGAFPDSHERELYSGGRIPFFSWVSTNYSTGADHRWADIAAGRYDESIIDPVARRLRDYGRKVFLDFDHEMDGRVRVDDGSPADYARAYRHIRERFDAIGADNVIFVWTTTGYLGNEEKIKASYPGDAYVDWIAYDPYNFGVCHGTPWKDFGTTVDTFYDWLMTHGHSDKPFMLGEYGTAPDPDDPYRRAQWFRGQVAGMKAHPNIKAVMYYNSHGSCPASISSSISKDAPALDAFGDAGRDPYFRVAH